MIVGVHPLAGFDKLLHYRVPEAMRESVAVGSLVRVPILSGMKLGIVGEVAAPTNFPIERLKSLAQVVYPFPALTPDLLDLARWMARYYACGLDSIIETMIPAAVRRGAAVKQEKLLSVAQKLSPEEVILLEQRAPQQARLYRLLVEQFRPQNKGFVLARLGQTPAAANAPRSISARPMNGRGLSPTRMATWWTCGRWRTSLTSAFLPITRTCSPLSTRRWRWGWRRAGARPWRAMASTVA